MKFFANRNTLVVLLSLAIASAICVPCQAQFGGEPSKQEKRLRELEKKVRVVGQFMVDLKKSPLADMQNSQVSVFRLKYLPANSAAVTISALLGEKGFRMATEEKSNQLIVSAPAEISKAIDELLQKIDTAPAQKNENRVASQQQSAPKSLQVHTFWLADEMPTSSRPDHLPESVIEALNKIGVRYPGIVAQSTTSLIAKSRNDVSMSESFMHATFKDHEFLFTNGVELSLNKEKHIELHVQTQILKGSEKKNACELRGSLTAPLGHYMVLGTTNYVAGNPEKDNMLDTSRFAFVIQVVEADSFAPDKSTSEPGEPVFDPFGNSVRPGQKAPPTKK